MISVIIPVYNVEDYIIRCVESLEHQKYSGEYEVLLINDGSLDTSLEKCQECSKKYTNVVTYSKQNGGLSSARNYGVNVAKGDWITFIDPDDYVSDNYLEDLCQLVKKYDADMAIITVELETEREALLNKPKRFEDFVCDKRAAFYEIYAKHTFNWSGCGKLVRRTVLLRHPFPNGYYEDSASAYLFIHECEKVAFGDYRNDYHYIRREGSITAMELSDKHYRIFEVCDEIRDYILQEYPEWQYVSILMYQNAILQLLTRLRVNKKEYESIFYRYNKMFRNNMKKIISQKELNWKVKCYAVILSTTPGVLKIFRKVIGILERR